MSSCSTCFATVLKVKHCSDMLRCCSCEAEQPTMATEQTLRKLLYGIVKKRKSSFNIPALQTLAGTVVATLIQCSAWHWHAHAASSQPSLRTQDTHAWGSEMYLAAVTRTHGPCAFKECQGCGESLGGLQMMHFAVH